MTGSNKDDGDPAGPIQNREARQASAVGGAQGILGVRFSAVLRQAALVGSPSGALTAHHLGRTWRKK